MRTTLEMSASVLYTIPVAAFSDSTAASAERTLSVGISLYVILSHTCSLRRYAFAYMPAGTVDGSATATLGMAGSARSFAAVIFKLLLLGTMITSVFERMLRRDFFTTSPRCWS